MLALKGCDTSRSRPTPTTSLPAESLKSTEVFWSSASRGPHNTVAQMHFAFGSTLARSARFAVFPRCHEANEDLEVELPSLTRQAGSLPAESGSPRRVRRLAGWKPDFRWRPSSLAFQ